MAEYPSHQRMDDENGPSDDDIEDMLIDAAIERQEIDADIERQEIDTPSHTIDTAHGWFCDMCGATVAVQDWRTVQTRHCDQCGMDRPVADEGEGND